jgi:hypothetical protein
LSDPSIDPRMQETSRRMARQNPNAETRVTRDALKAFTSSHNYNPDFLRDETLSGHISSLRYTSTGLLEFVMKYLLCSDDS